MTSNLLPIGLAGLPVPWNLTSDRARRRALGDAGNLSTQDALDALDRSLSALPTLPEPAAADLPEELTEFFGFTADWFAEAMPRLDDVATSTIAELLAARSGAPAPATQTQALAALWLGQVTVGIAKDAMRWLADALPRRGDTPAVDRLVDIVRRETRRQPVDLASLLLSGLADLGRPVADPELSAVAADEDADAELRRHARSLRIWLANTPISEVVVTPASTEGKE